tara:strand:+ start:997 stop:1632 length:636 start_codon:yes stop_codon:yes gene_type:complete
MPKPRKRDAKGVFLPSEREDRKDREARRAERLAEAKRTGDLVEIERNLKQQEGKKARQALFIEGLKEMGTVRNGIRKAGVHRRAYREWMSTDPEFPEMVLDARQEFAEALEEVVVGIVMDPETVKKVPILAITLLNANLPNKYRPTAIVQDEAARDLLREWRKAAREHPKEVKETNRHLDIPVEQQIDEILKQRGKPPEGAPVPDVTEEMD